MSLSIKLLARKVSDLHAAGCVNSAKLSLGQNWMIIMFLASRLLIFHLMVLSTTKTCAVTRGSTGAMNVAKMQIFLDARVPLSTPSTFNEHTQGGVKAELPQCTQLVSFAKQLVLAACIQDVFFALLSQSRVCLQTLEFHRENRNRRENPKIETRPKRIPGKSDAVTLCFFHVHMLHAQFLLLFFQFKHMSRKCIS